MKTSLLLVAFAGLLSSSFAAPTTSTVLASSGTLAGWSVTNFTEGCSPGGCAYSFNIAYPGSTSEPAFSTTCTGTDVAYKLQPCQDPSIMANEVSGVGSFTLVVQHAYTTANGARYFVKGNHTVVVDGTPHSDFTIMQTEFRAVGKIVE